MLVLDAVGEIDAVRQGADLRLDDMGGRGRTVRHVPFVLPVEQSSFFLRAGKRDAEFLVGADAERIAREVADDRRNLFVVHGATIDGARGARRHLLREGIAAHRRSRGRSPKAGCRYRSRPPASVRLRAGGCRHCRAGDFQRRPLPGRRCSGLRATEAKPRREWRCSKSASPCRIGNRSRRCSRGGAARQAGRSCTH